MHVLNYYDKPEIHNFLGNKLDASTYNTGIVLKASLTDVYNKNVLYTKTETDGLIANINLSSYYDKPEINTILSNKWDTTTYNSGISFKANISDVYYKNMLYTQTEINNLLSSKLNSSEISNHYNTTHIDNLISSYYAKTQND